MIHLEYTKRYYVDKILPSVEVSYLNDLYYINAKGKIKKEDIHGVVNRGHIRGKDAVIDSVEKQLREHAIRVNKSFGRSTELKLKTMYFQEYLQYSHLPEHRDVISSEGVTLVTLIDRSDDLIGGELLLIDRVADLWKEHGVNAIKHDPYTRIADKDGVRVYTLLPQEVGETAMYIAGTVHSISRVLQGTRLVLVSWFDT
jgi:hypothetical protein